MFYRLVPVVAGGGVGDADEGGDGAVLNVMAIVGRVVFRSKNAAVAASRRQLLKARPRRSAFTGLSRL